MKKFIVSVIASTLLLASAQAEDVTPPTPPYDIIIEKDTTTGSPVSVEYTYKLKAGWNMLGLAGYKTFKIAELFGSSEIVQIIYVYSPSSNSWTTFANASTDTDSVKTLVPGMGYWIFVTKPFTISYRSNIVSEITTWEETLIKLDASAAAIDINGTELTITANPLDTTELVNADGTINTTAVNEDSNSTLVTAITDSNGTTAQKPKYVFDMTLIGNSAWTDVAGRVYQFVGTKNRTGVVSISDTTGSEATMKNGKFTIAASGVLNVSVNNEKQERPDKKKPEKAEKPDKSDKKEKPEKADKSDKKNGKDKSIRKSGKDIKFTLKIVEIEKTATGGTKLKLINQKTKAPNIWTLSMLYNKDSKTWVNATSIPTGSSSSASDEDSINWDNVTGEDSDLNDIDEVEQESSESSTESSSSSESTSSLSSSEDSDSSVSSSEESDSSVSSSSSLSSSEDSDSSVSSSTEVSSSSSSVS